MTSKDEAKQDVIVEITNLDQMAQLLILWHAQKVKILEHMLQLPEDTEMTVIGEEPIVLAGESLLCFKAGIQVALMELGKLPFVPQEDAEPEAHAA